jgi:hypothetical protein
MNKRQELEAARNMEADCTLGAGAGFGKYTREVSQLRRGTHVSRVQVSRVLLDSDPSELGPVRQDPDHRGNVRTPGTARTPRIGRRPMSTKTSDLAKLLTANVTREMTPEQKETQRRSFVYGNTKIENEEITRDTVNKAAEQLSAMQKKEESRAMMSSLIKFVRALEADLRDRSCRWDTAAEGDGDKIVSEVLFQIAESISSAAKATLLA